MQKDVDVIVLGAGSIGLCAALHLQQRGRNTVLVDRLGAPGRETSYGNAGLIERASLKPYMFPLELGTLLQFAFNRSPAARYHLNALPEVLPWIVRYALNSTATGVARTAGAALPLIARSVLEHEALMQAADSTSLLRRTGWIKLFSSQRAFDKAARETQLLAQHGLTTDILDRAALAEREPHLAGGNGAETAGASGALHYRDPCFVPDPAALSQSYLDLLVRRGGALLTGDARTLTQTQSGWRIVTAEGTLTAKSVVIALGPWSNQVLAPLGYRIPLGIKRGYHMHYGARGNAVLNHPVLDDAGGYLLAPMNQGIRLTTGAEFARFDAGPTPVQLERVEPVARSLFPLAERRDAVPWMGRRPCLPDMLPIIGKAPRHQGLWLNFGHQHHGLTLSAVSGRLLAEMMTDAVPFTDPQAYSIERFG